MSMELFRKEGIKIGQIEDARALTGCTVVICEEGASCGVDVRGGAPGTRETDLLDPVNMVDKVHAVVLSGGSAFGLDAMSGVCAYLEEQGIGFDVGVTRVPIVTGAVLFDLHIGDYKVRPDFKMGYEAAKIADHMEFKQGNYGAGCGCSVGKFKGEKHLMKSGIGIHTIEMESGLFVSAIVAVNAFGDIYENSKIIAGALNDEKDGFADTVRTMLSGGKAKEFSMKNTTIGMVITNAKLDKAKATKISQVAHDGYAKAICPVHTMFDGDTIFTLATGKQDADMNLIGIMAVEAMEKAIISGVKTSKTVQDIASYSELKCK